MTVFKGYMKILKQNMGLVIMYLAIFFSVALAMQAASGKEESSLYQNTSIDIGIVDEDDSELSRGFTDYLSTIHNITFMKNDQETLQENLFYRNVKYIIFIPENFYQTCIQDGNSLKVTKIPGSYSSYYVDQQISNFFSTLRTYLASGFSVTEAIQAIKTQEHSPVTKLTDNLGSSDVSPFIYYFRYIPYLFLGALCYTMGYILMAFKKGDIQKRLEASAISTKRQVLEGLLAMSMIGFGLWLLGILGAFIMYGSQLKNCSLLGYYVLNTLIMLLVALSLSYLLGMFITNSNMLSGVANIVSLAMCFLCGVFVPMDVMDKSVLKAAQFLPVYWYEKVNDILGTHHALSHELISQVTVAMGIQLLFAGVFVCLVLVIFKYRKEE